MASATANSSVSNGGPALATATGGNGRGEVFPGNGGAATANASATNGGSAVATATGGNGGNGGNGGSGNGGLASATASSTAVLGGNANATATATGGNGGSPYPSIAGAGAANANSFATTINGNTAQSQSTAVGSSGQAQATAQTNFGNFNSVQAVATSPVGGGTTPANAIAQAGGVISLSNAINPGQSFSVVSFFDPVSLTIALGSMGAGYGGTGAPLTYQESANFIFNAIGVPLLVYLFNDASLGNGFDSAAFQIILNGIVVDSQSFTDLASAQAFFSHNLIAISLAAGPDDVQLAPTSFWVEG